MDIPCHFIWLPTVPSHGPLCEDTTHTPVLWEPCTEIPETPWFQLVAVGD